MRTAGYWWNDEMIEVVEIDGLYLALNGWNGEAYTDSFYVRNMVMETFYDLDEKNEGRFTATPIYDGKAELISYHVIRS